MIGLIQRVTHAQVVVKEQVIGAIDKGILALIGVTPRDNEAEARRLLDKMLSYRIFEDDAGKMNKSLKDCAGGLLLVPQFTLLADTRKGLRPSFSGGAPPELGKSLFAYLCEYSKTQHEQTEIGRFGADMQVSLTNDGPATFILDTEK